MTAGIEAEFRCQHSDANFIGWRVNNQSIECSPLPGVSQDHVTLIVLALPEYNATVIECVALYLNGSSELAPPAYLIVEGRVVQGIGLYYKFITVLNTMYVSVMSFTIR